MSFQLTAGSGESCTKPGFVAEEPPPRGVTFWEVPDRDDPARCPADQDETALIADIAEALSSDMAYLLVFRINQGRSRAWKWVAWQSFWKSFRKKESICDLTRFPWMERIPNYRTSLHCSN